MHQEKKPFKMTRFPESFTKLYPTAIHRTSRKRRTSRSGNRGGPGHSQLTSHPVTELRCTHIGYPGPLKNARLRGTTPHAARNLTPWKPEAPAGSTEAWCRDPPQMPVSVDAPPLPTGGGPCMHLGTCIMDSQPWVTHTVLGIVWGQKIHRKIHPHSSNPCCSRVTCTYFCCIFFFLN